MFFERTHEKSQSKNMGTAMKKQMRDEIAAKPAFEQLEQRLLLSTSTFASDGIYNIQASAEVSATTYYVATDGDDSALGTTVDEPWKTVVKAITTAGAGDTVYFRGGTYRTVKSATDSNIISIGTTPGAMFSTAGDANNRITFKSYPEETAIITSMKLRDELSDWTLVRGNVYSTDLLEQELDTERVERVSNCSEDGVPLRLMTAYGDSGDENDLDGPGQWSRDINDHKLYVWSTDGNNPGTHQTEFSEFVHGGSSTIEIMRNPSDDDDEADYLTFEGLVIEGGLYPIDVFTDYIEIKNCVIRNSYGDGIKGEGAEPADYDNPDDPSEANYFNCSYGLIEGCDIYNFGESGIDITGGDYWIIRENVIHDNANVRGDLPWPYSGANGIILKNNNIGTIVERNRIYDLDTAHGAVTLGGVSWGGIAEEGVNLIVKNNIIYNVSGPYIVLFAAAKDCSFYNNLIYDCNAVQGIIRFGLSNRNHSDWGNDGCVIKNNIFYDNVVDPGVGGHNLAYYEHDPGSVSNLESNNNRIDPNQTYYWGGSNRTLAYWRDTLGQDVGSIDDVPTFVDAANHDFHCLDSSSPQVDAGASGDYSTWTDMDKEDRVMRQGIDIGPDELGGPCPGLQWDGDADGDGKVEFDRNGQVIDKP